MQLLFYKNVFSTKACADLKEKSSYSHASDKSK